MKVFAETERLILREVIETDVDGFFELDSNPDVHNYLGNRPIKTKTEADNIIRHIRKQYKENGIGRWAIEDKKTTAFLGWTGLKLEKENINNHLDYYDLGCRIIAKYWGQGIALESSKTCLKYGFEHLKLPTIYAAAQIENLASNAILKKLGFFFHNSFDYDGSHHNWYSISKTDWETEATCK